MDGLTVDVPQMTGRENTRFACRIQGLHSDEMEPIVDYVQSFADIGKFFDMPARVYSSGMRARLGFGITMAFDFDFYIIDELSAVGDSVFKAKATKIFKQKRLKAGFVRARVDGEILDIERVPLVPREKSGKYRYYGRATEPLPTASTHRSFARRC